MKSTSNHSTSKQKNDFGNMLLKILNAINYESVSLYSDPKRFHELNQFESYEEMRPFVTWFTKSISEENCVTIQELDMYKNLKKSGDLVTEEDLDCLIESFCTETPSSTLLTDLGPSTLAAMKELEALESLEKYLTESDKYKSSSMNSEVVDSEISSELNEIDELNTQFNAALEDFAKAWQDLRSNISLEQTESNKLPEIIHNINTVEKQISDNLHHHLSNDFQEVRPTEGLLNVSTGDYRIVFNGLNDLRKKIIRTVSIQEGLVLYNECLGHLGRKLNTRQNLSLEEIRDLLDEPYSKYRLQNSVNDLLKSEKDCLYKFQIEDALKGNKYLTDRLQRLSKIEHTLKQKKLYHHALLWVTERNILVHNFQLDKLQEYFQMIQSYYNKYEERMNVMKKYQPKNEECLDQNLKKMMYDLNVSNMDLSSLDAAISELHKKISEFYETISTELESFQLKVLKSLKSSKEKERVYFEGPTREIFRQRSNSLIDPLESTGKGLLAIENKTNKIRGLYQNLTTSGNSGEDCVWLKCFNNPKDFISEIQEMQAKFKYLMSKNLEK